MLSRLKSSGVVMAFLLACLSWVIVTAAWTQASPGGLIDKIAGNLLSPAYRIGKHLAHLFFPNDNGRNAVGNYLGLAFGVAAEIVFLTVLWFLGIGLRKWTRVRKVPQPPARH
jgi:hypothetical protein